MIVTPVPAPFCAEITAANNSGNASASLCFDIDQLLFSEPRASASGLDFEKDLSPIQPITNVDLKADHQPGREHLAQRSPPVDRPAHEYESALAEQAVQNLVKE